jgi:cytochrome P450
MVTTDNRDAAVFDNADTVDVDHKPNRHIAMGHGIHRCVGVALARAQLRVAARQLLAMTDTFAVSSWSHLGSEAADALRAPNNPRLSQA